MCLSHLGAQPTSHQDRAKVRDPPSGHRAGESPRRGAAERRERHVAHEQQARGGTHLRSDQRADDGARGPVHGLLFVLGADFGHPGGFVRRRRNPPEPRILQGFLRESPR
jgi:hypothetical protein